MSKLNANHLEIHVKRIAYFSWGWRNNRCLDVGIARGWCMGLQSLQGSPYRIEEIV